MRCARTKKIISLLTQGSIISGDVHFMNGIYAEKIDRFPFSEIGEVRADLMIEYASKTGMLVNIVRYILEKGTINDISFGTDRTNATKEIADLIVNIREIPEEIRRIYSLNFFLANTTFYSRSTINSVLKKMAEDNDIELINDRVKSP